MPMQWVNIADAVTALRKDRRTIERHIRKGMLDSRLVGGRRFVFVDVPEDPVKPEEEPPGIDGQVVHLPDYLSDRLAHALSAPLEMSQRQTTRYRKLAVINGTVAGLLVMGLLVAAWFMSESQTELESAKAQIVDANKQGTERDDTIDRLRVELTTSQRGSTRHETRADDLAQNLTRIRYERDEMRGELLRAEREVAHLAVAIDKQRSLGGDTESP